MEIENKLVTVSQAKHIYDKIFTVKIVDTLPATGETSRFYLVPKKSGKGYDKYWWVTDESGVSKWDVFGGSATLVVSTLPAVGEEDIDYILSTADGCQYYKWFGGAWHMVAGSTDNFVTEIDENDAGIVVSYKDGSSKSVNVKDSEIKVREINEVEGGISIVYTDDSTKEIGISGGGDSGGSASITRITDTVLQCVYGDSCPIRFTFTAADSAGDAAGDGTATWYVGNVKKTVSTVRQGENVFDIGKYLNVGSNKIKVSVSVDTGGSSPRTTTKTWTVNAVNLYAVWNYDDTVVNDAEGTVIRWTPYGDLEKTTHILIDGVETITSITERSGTRQSASLGSLSHGSHMVELYLTATVNDLDIRSETIRHNMIFAESGNTAPVISCSLSDTEMTQYDSLRIPIVVYDPGSLTADVVLKENGETVAEWKNVDRTQHYWNYSPNDYGDKVLTITCGATVKTLNIRVNELAIDNKEVGGYTFRMKAGAIQGNDMLRSWSDNGVDVSFSDNFDWKNGGIQTEFDESGNPVQYICVKTGTRMTINSELFADDAKVSGKTFKMIFKVENCREYDAQVAQCYADNIGIRMFAHNAEFSSSGTSLSVPYGEDEYIEMEFDVYPAPRMENDGNYRYVMAWIDGVITTARIYNSSDSFTQSSANKQKFVIGSDNCDVYVYLVKAYPHVLTRDNHIENFIADAPNAQEMVKRYNRNNILDASGEISYEKLAEQNPDCRVWLYDIPRLTQGKKDKVSGCSFQQIWKNGDQYYQLTGKGTMTVQGTSSVDYLKGAANTDINFVGGELRDGYGNDLLSNSLTQKGFKIHDDSTPITYSNTKVNFASCEQVNNMCNAEWYQRFQPYPRLTPRDCMEFSMGVQFINDRSGALWDDNKYHMYSIGNMGTSKKNVEVFHDTSNPKEVCIEVNNNLNDQCRMISDDLSNEDWSGDYYFGMRYPDTKNPSNEIKNGWQRFLSWMAASNPNAATGNKLDSPVTYDVYTFRGHDRAGTQVLKGTNVTQYAGTYTHDTFEYRMAKMLSECEDYMVMDSVVYHFVYLERHTMVDNVSKNSFWSSSDLLHWDLSKAYDMDTSDGNNNEGQMVFDYGNEATDTIGTKTVFNAADSVWFVFVSNLYEACRTMFIDREAAGAWSAAEYHKYFLSEQQKVPERVWVQCYWYDYLRTYEQGISGAWMSFLDGGQKTHQRWHYESFEEAYDASKYRGIASTAQNVTFRGYTPEVTSGMTEEEAAAINTILAAVPPKNQISVKMYNKCYIVVKIDQIYKSVKAERGKTYTIDFSDVGKLNDTVINLYTSQMIQEIGDLPMLYPGHCNFSNATRLRSLQIGSDVPGYANTNFDAITLEGNTMLEYLYVQNLPNANQGLDLKNCISLLHLDARGSSFTAYDFAAGGLLEEAYLESPTSLTLRNLQYLTDETLHISNYGRLVRLRLENCPQLDSLALVNAATNLNSLRIIGLNWTLSDQSKLKALSNKNAYGGIDDSEAGLNTEYAVLSGDVQITGGELRQSDLNAYHAIWPNLAITYPASIFITQFAVSYVNDDGSLLHVEYVDAYTVPPNIAASKCEIYPTKAPTQSVVYTFSGWNADDRKAPVTGNGRTVRATYSQSARKYTVSWYALSTDSAPIASVQAAYGAEAVYPESTKGIPVNETQEQSAIYNVFSGWDKCTASITADTKVYAKWSSANLNTVKTALYNGTKSLKNMTPAEIFAIAKSGSIPKLVTDKIIENKDYIDITIGRDFDFDGINSTVLAQNFVVDGTNIKDTKVALFSSEMMTKNSFTLAIDYNCKHSDTRNLFRCGPDTSNTAATSFNQHYVSNSSVSCNYVNCFGTDVALGRYQHREMLVLRHVKGTNTVQMYISSNSSKNGDIFSANVEKTTFTVPSYSTETLKFGGTFSITNRYLGGIIHWAKLWYDDLGENNAKLLASWPHERVRAEFCGTGRYALADGSGKSCSATFIANACLASTAWTKYVVDTTSTVTSRSWDTWDIRTMMNGRLFDSFPTVWRSIIKKVKVPTAGWTSESPYQKNVITEDYLHLPSSTEVGGGAISGYNNGTAISWMTTQLQRTKALGCVVPDGVTLDSSSSQPTKACVWYHDSDYKLVQTATEYFYNGPYNTYNYKLSDSDFCTCNTSYFATRTSYANSRGSYLYYLNYNSTITNSYSKSNSLGYGICPMFSI